MASVPIDYILPFSQFIATGSQTVFNTSWTSDSGDDVRVYNRAAADAADDATQLVDPADYTVTFVGADLTVRVTFGSAVTDTNIVTVVRATDADRMNLYTNTNFNPTMLNSDFNRLIMMSQERILNSKYLPSGGTETGPRYNNSESISTVITGELQSPRDIILPLLEALQVWQMNSDRTAIVARQLPGIIPGLQGNFTDDNRLVKTTDFANNLLEQTDIVLSDANVISGLAGAIIAGLTYPTSDGSNGQAIVTDGAGNLSFTGIGMGTVTDVTGTANQIDVATGATTPALSLSPTLNLPGTFTIQGTTAVNAIIDDDTMATALATNLSTSEAIKTYVDNTVAGTGQVDSVVGTANEIDIDATDAANPIASLSSTTVFPGTVTLNADPTTALQAATKSYVDEQSGAGEKQIAQTAHGFTGGEWIYNNAGTYTAAIATSAAASEVVGVVSAVADANNFTLQINGYTTSQTGLTANTVYFLSTSVAGALQTTQTTTVGQVVKPLLVTDKGAAGTTSGVMLTYRGDEVVSSTALTINRAVITDGSGALDASATTSTELGYVAGVTSGIQAQIDAISGLLNIQYLTSGTAATYTPTAGTKSIIVECVGGGGGGGSTTTTASTLAGAGGGGSGGHCQKLITGIDSGSYTGTYTIGAGGAAASNGTATTYGDGTVSLSAGLGVGAASVTGVAAGRCGAGGAPGASTGGDLNLTGSAGSFGFAGSGIGAFGGSGGGLGGGGSGGATAGSAAGANTGGGGGGSGNNGGNTTYAGGVGGSGVIIVKEFS